VLERLIYKSIATQTLGSLHLFHLLTEARKRNKQLGITGLLIYTQDQFYQCIEGTPQALDQMWRSLQSDPRHHDLALLVREPQGSRQFADWRMAFASYPQLNRYQLPGFFPLEKNLAPMKGGCDSPSLSIDFEGILGVVAGANDRARMDQRFQRRHVLT